MDYSSESSNSESSNIQQSKKINTKTIIYCCQNYDNNFGSSSNQYNNNNITFYHNDYNNNNYNNNEITNDFCHSNNKSLLDQQKYAKELIVAGHQNKLISSNSKQKNRLIEDNTKFQYNDKTNNNRLRTLPLDDEKESNKQPNRDEEIYFDNRIRTVQKSGDERDNDGQENSYDDKASENKEQIGNKRNLLRATKGEGKRGKYYPSDGDDDNPDKYEAGLADNPEDKGGTNGTGEYKPNSYNESTNKTLLRRAHVGDPNSNESGRGKNTNNNKN